MHGASIGDALTTELRFLFVWIDFKNTEGFSSMESAHTVVQVLFRHVAWSGHCHKEITLTTELENNIQTFIFELLHQNEHTEGQVQGAISHHHSLPHSVDCIQQGTLDTAPQIFPPPTPLWLLPQINDACSKANLRFL